jgi:hypothetical protein
MFLFKSGARGAVPGGRQGPGACDSGGGKEARRLVPRPRAEEVVRHVAAAVHVDGQHEGCHDLCGRR